jgi:hypothetical protein
VNPYSSLTWTQIESWGPEVIMERVAVEFGHAAQNAQLRETVLVSYYRARGLMGVLETISFDSPTAMKLAPFYRLCSLRQLFREDRLQPYFAAHFAAIIGKAFKRAAQELTHA